jgi:multidrug transporter EmrE-like cation transporter
MNKLLIILYVLTTSGALTMIKLGSTGGAVVSIVDGKLAFNLNTFSVCGIIAYGISFLLYLSLLSKYEIGFIIPLTTGLIYILIFAASYFIFHEPFSLLKVLAIVLIVVGVFLLNYSQAVK